MKFSRNSKRGLSLIEMLVVLGVIVAVAGMIVVNATSTTDKATDSTIISTINSAKSALNGYALNNNNEPNNFDSLVNAANELHEGVELLLDSTAEIAATSVDDVDGLDALEAAGITVLREMNADGVGDATYNNTTGNPIDLTAASAFIATLTLAGKTNLNLDTAEEYAVFGLGPDCTLVGSGIEDAPTCAPESGTPNERYSRFLVIYQLTDNGGTVLQKAKRVEVISSHIKTKAQHEAQFHTQN